MESSHIIENNPEFRAKDIQVLNFWRKYFLENKILKGYAGYEKLISAQQNLKTDNAYFARKESDVTFAITRGHYSFVPCVLLVDGIPIQNLKDPELDAGAILAFKTENMHTFLCFNRDAGSGAIKKCKLPDDIEKAKSILATHKYLNLPYGGKSHDLNEQIRKLSKRKNRLHEEKYRTKSGKTKINMDYSFYNKNNSIQHNEALIRPMFLQTNNATRRFSDISHIILADETCGGLTWGNVLFAFMMQHYLSGYDHHVGIYYYNSKEGKHYPLPFIIWVILNKHVVKFINNNNGYDSKILNLSFKSFMAKIFDDSKKNEMALCALNSEELRTLRLVDDSSNIEEIIKYSGISNHYKNSGLSDNEISIDIIKILPFTDYLVQCLLIEMKPMQLSALVADLMMSKKYNKAKEIVDNYKISIDYRCNDTDYTLLHLAVIANQPELVVSFLNAGADLKATATSDDHSPLSLAIHNNDICMMKVLFPHMMSINLLPTCNYKLQLDDLGIAEKYNLKNNFDKKHITIQQIPTCRIEMVGSNMKEPIIESMFSHDAAFTYYEKNRIAPLVIVFANGFKSGGNGASGNRQEEQLLKLSDYTVNIMPNNLRNGNVESFGGIYTIKNTSLVSNNKFAIVDFAFVAMPNIGDALHDQATPAEGNYFSPRTYLYHVTSLVILQFYLARFSGKVMITGRQGCGLFKNDDEIISAIIRKVNEMPEFLDIQVIYALGKNFTPDNCKRPLYQIYQYPLKEITDDIGCCIDEIRFDSNMDINIISKNIVENYKLGKEVIKKMDPIIKFIDEVIIKHLNKGYQTKFNGAMTFWVSNDTKTTWDDMKKKKIKCMNDAKVYIKNCLNLGMTLDQAVSDFKQTYADIIYSNRDGFRVASTKTSRLLDQLVTFCNKENENIITSIRLS